MTTTDFCNCSVAEVETQLRTDAASGLTDDEAVKRLGKDGYNEFERKKHKSLLVKFLDQYKSFMILVLLAAAVISGVVGYIEGKGFTDAIIILVIVVLNAVIGVAQEAKAEKSLEALEKLSSPRSTVLRNGQVREIDARELVAGDVVLLETGDSVPADIRLTEAVNLKIQEAALTGESVPGEKFTKPIAGEVSLGDRDNMAYASTSVTYGRGRGIVTATGMRSEVGKIASMIQSVPDVKTPMQQRLDKLGQILAIAALAISSLIFIIGILYGRDLLGMFMIAVSLAAAAIPEGLPAVSTIVLAVGVQRLVKRNAIVRKLPSVETLGSVRIICSDKTGTLTQNCMTVVGLYVDETIIDLAAAPLPENSAGLLQAAILANDATLSRENDTWKTVGDPTETAILDLGMKAGLLKDALERDMPRVAEIPFDSERKMMTTVHQHNGALQVCVKGGLDELLAGCRYILEDGQVRDLTNRDREKIAAANLRMAGKALRVLAVGRKEIAALPGAITPATLEHDLVFLGMIGMIDPPREEVRVAVDKCRSAGIKPVMITGDHAITAVTIAESLGIKGEDDHVLTGVELEKMPDEVLRERVETVAVYARVSPEHKVRIVKAFQTNGEVVAMTGDGVNDAPALKLADIGVAMGVVGTDVSKEAADIVLTDDNFATIVSAVEEGRRIYDNIVKAILFLLSTNIGELLVLFIAVLFNWESPLLPIHILWINLVSDSLPALALSVDPADAGIMNRPPFHARKGIMTRSFTIRMLLQGALIGGLSLSAYGVGLPAGVEIARTMTFAVLAFSQVVFIFGVRSGSRSAFRGMFNNIYLIGALLVVLALMFIVLEIPVLKTVFHIADLSAQQWLWVTLLSLVPLPVTELAKIVIRCCKR
ncbi:MAG: calcium-translocating P-type ATPase, PMCA-type [Prevotellaceae bacterium]|jgi:Ca2+-transporting ATPase|nr:calcium-translocating P-type ATPase, PMCA-type [Prevotellaceae bacterium]